MPEDVRISEGIADSINGGINAVAPGAASVVLQVASGVIPAGVYEVRARARVGVGAVANDDGNMRLIFPSGSFILPTDGSEKVFPRTTFNGAQACSISAIAAGTAGVVYTASLTLTRIA